MVTKNSTPDTIETKNVFTRPDSTVCKMFYDIETLPHNFSVVFYSTLNKKCTIFSIDDASIANKYNYDHISKELSSRWSDGKEDVISAVEVCPLTNGNIDESNPNHARFVSVLRLFSQQAPWKNGIIEFYGWNSDGFDLTIMGYICLEVINNKHIPKPYILKSMANAIIDRRLRFPKSIENDDIFKKDVFQYEYGLDPYDVEIKSQRYKEMMPKFELSMRNWEVILNKCRKSQNHVDIGAINEKSLDSKGGVSMFPLKTIASYVGLDIVEDETTRIDFSTCGGNTEETWEDYDTLSDELKEKVLPNGALTEEALTDMLHYNINDVIVTYEISKEEEYADNLEVKDSLRKKYPFLNDPASLRPLPRSATMAQISGRIIRGEHEVKLKDNDKVSMMYPFNDGIKRDLLDYVKEHENIHPLAYEFYDHFRGSDVRTVEKYQKVLAGSITNTARMGKKNGQETLINEGGASCNIPYMKDGKATNTYVTLSLGGCHGGVITEYKDKYTKEKIDIYGKSMSEDEDWKEAGKPEDEGWLRRFAKSKISTSSTSTVDVENIVHADFASYYPSMNILFGVYKTDDQDNYKEVRDERVVIKNSVPSDVRDWTAEDRKNENIQLGMKLVINSATGASNQRKPYADLPLDNRTTQMRITGNILMYVMGQRFTDAGAFVFSTNTDGLYATNISMEKAKEICDDFMSTYGLSVDPEPLSRMINKSSNERVEFEDPTVPNKVGGKLSRSMGNRIPLSSNIDYPRVSGKAVLDYMCDNRKWLDDEIDIKILKRYVEKYLSDEFYNPIDWFITLKGNKQRKFVRVVDGEEESLSATNRVMLTKNDSKIIQYFKNKEQKITGFTTQNLDIVNTREELMNYNRENYDVDAYVEWAYNLLKTWHVRRYIPQYDGVIEREGIDYQTVNDYNVMNFLNNDN